MELKDRKLIANGALPKFDLGLSNLPDEKTGLLKLENSMLKSGQFVRNSTGGLEPNMLAQKSGGAGAFLKNNAGGIMNIASTGIDFFSTLGDVSKNKITSDQIMGSGGQTSGSVNGISYQQSKVDEAGISNQIDATAKAGTMASMGKGAALGGAIGSVIPGLGTVAGGAIGGAIGGLAGLFGSSKAKEEARRQMRIAVDRTIASNTQNREMAYTTGLRNEFNRENRTDISQSLFHAETGAENLKINPITGETIKKFKVNTAFGPVWDTANSQTHTGEMIISKLGPSSIVKNGPHDNALTHLRDGDTVVTARKDIISPKTGRPIIFDAYEMAMNNGGVFSEEEKNELDMNQRIGKMMMYAGKRKPHTNTGHLGGTLKKLSLGDENITDIWNKEADALANNWYLPTNINNLPKPAPVITSNPQVTTNPTTTTNTVTPGSKTPGFLSKLWGGIKNAGSGLDLGNITQLANAYSIAAQRDARAEGIRAPESFVDNPYRREALDELDRLQSDYYSVWAGNRELEGRGKSSIAQSGGLSAGQKMLGYMGLANQTQQNNMAALFEHQNRQNALRAQAANAKLQAGEQMATRQQQAYQWDEDMLAKAHAAQDNMFETSAYDRQNGLTQFFKNLWEKNQFDRTMNLYETDQKMSEADREFYRNQFIKNNKPAAPIAPTLADKAASTVTAAGIASLHPSQTAVPADIVPTIKIQTPQPVVKTTTAKRGKKATAGVKKPAGKGKSATSSTETSSVTTKPVAASYTPYAFGNPAIQERFPNASAEAKLARPNKEKAGRPVPTSNAEALSRLWERIKLGKREYERRYGKD